jgi:hypothetical protein
MGAFAGLCLFGAAQAETSAHEQEHARHKNEIAGFVGLTHEGRDDGLSLGVEYERRVTEAFGVGVLAEYTSGDFDYWVFAVPLTLHVNRWKFAVAPGIEKTDEHEHEMARLTLGYEFDLGKAKVTPSFSVDFVDGEQVYVLGAAIGFGF